MYNIRTSNRERGIMTTTISMPQKLGNKVTRAAASMGISESKLFVAAVQEYLLAREFDARIESAGIESIRELTKNDTW
jgi:metal-responsive CopG/Arc/MetJ family transcriptional regulator